MRKLLTVVALLALASCDPITGLDGARRIDGAFFRSDFMATAECVGISEDSASYLFSRTRWYRAPGLPGDTAGLWVGPYEIHLRGGYDEPPRLIHHETIHLIAQNGSHNHPAFGRLDRSDGCEVPAL